MKTPREVLLSRHASVESQLDSLRQRALASVPPPESKANRGPGAVNILWHALAPWSRHALGLLAAWTVIATLQFESGRRDSGAPVARHTAASPRSFLAQLHEHRRQIRELLPPDGEFPMPPTQTTPSLLWHRRPTAGATTT